MDAPTRDDVLSAILPALSAAAAGDDASLQHEAAIALGRAVDEGDAAIAAAALRDVLKSRHGDARHAAILGLGATGHRGMTPLLWGILHDTKDGRECLGGEAASAYERASAALAFGMVADGGHARALLRLIRRDAGSSQEVAAAAVLALGLLRGADAERVVVLHEVLDDPRLPDAVRAQAPVALAWIGDVARALSPALLDALRDKNTPRSLRQSCAIALSRLGAAGDDDVVHALADVARQDADADLRHLAVISLGRLAERAAQDPRAADGVRSLLLGRLADVRHAADLPWLALAAGLAARGAPAGSPAREAAGEALGSALLRRRDPSSSAALAIAIGLAGAGGQGDRVLALFREQRDPAARAHLAVALGLLGRRDAADDLLAALDDDQQPRLRVEAATALALLGDRRAIPRLLDLMDAASGPHARASAALALARTGDRAAIAALRRLCLDGATDGERDVAAAALGRLAEGGLEPWNGRLAVDMNPFAAPPIQRELIAMF